MPATFRLAELSRAPIARFVRVRKRVACVVSIPSARMARAPPGAVVIVIRPARVPTAVMTSRVANDAPAGRQPVWPGVSEPASLASVRNGAACVPVFVSTPDGAAQRLQRTAVGEPLAAPATATAMKAAAAIERSRICRYRQQPRDLYARRLAGPISARGSSKPTRGLESPDPLARRATAPARASCGSYR